MCGILGFFSKKKAITGRQYYMAHKQMENRGPDDEGFLVFEDTIKHYRGGRTINKFGTYPHIQVNNSIFSIISHVRLSIIDLSYAGHQPFVSADERYAMVYNGEVYNYLQIRKELEKLGEKFNTDTDTEVVLKAYIKWGKNAFNKFNGMWAIAIWDRKNSELILCRDRFGIKPLFYYNDFDRFIFASDINSILEFLDSYNADLNTVSGYLSECNICSDDRTFFEGIKEVLPGNYVVYKDNRAVKCKYWNYNPGYVKMNETEALEQFSQIFIDAVKIRMRSDVEVGSLLSGGLDSNTIVGTIGRLGLLNNNYKTFSAIYKEKKYSEDNYIDKTVEKWKIQSNYIQITPEQILVTLPKAIKAAASPTRAIPMIIQYEIYHYIKNNSDIKVVLNGQGADELFGGYTDNYYTLFYSMLRSMKLCKLLKNARLFNVSRNRGIKEIINQTLKQCKSLQCKSPANEVFNRITFQQVTNTPLREYLMYDDRASMAWGIEARAPFMDYRLVEFAFVLDEQYKINSVNNKYIIRKYANGIVDKDILDRKDKMGFTSPQERWQKEVWKSKFDDTFERINTNGVFDFDKHAFYEDYINYSGGGKIDWAYIWRIVCLREWMDVYSL